MYPNAWSQGQKRADAHDVEVPINSEPKGIDGLQQHKPGPTHFGNVENDVLGRCMHDTTT